MSPVKPKYEFVILQSGLLALGFTEVLVLIVNSIHIVWMVFKPKTRYVNQNSRFHAMALEKMLVQKKVFKNQPK